MSKSGKRAASASTAARTTGASTRRLSPSRKETEGSTDDRLSGLVFREVDRSRLSDLVTLFESRGGPKNCWCMVWRATPEEARRKDGASRKGAFTGRVSRGIPVGLLGYVDEQPIAWCSIAPRSTYRDLGGVADAAGENVWSLVCFFVTRTYRSQGLTARLIDAAIDHARQRGATVIEAYPVDPDSPSYRFMGFVSAFEKAGFVEVGRAGMRRRVMRLELHSSACNESKQP